MRNFLFLLFFLTLILVGGFTKAQTLETFQHLKLLPFSMSWDAKSMFNPAASGVENKYYVALMGKEQWVGINNGPRDWSVLCEMKSELLHGGVGINYIYTTIFNTQQNHYFNAKYSYHIKLDHDKILSAGISGGLTLWNYDFSKEPPYVGFKGQKKFYDFQFGLFYHSNHLSIGINSIHFEHLKLEPSDKSISSKLYLFSSYRFDLGELFDITPLLMIWPENKTQKTIFSSAIICAIKNRYRVGFIYYNDDTYGATTSVDIAGLVKLGYLFEINTKVSGIEYHGNHEVLVALMIK